MRFHVLMTTSMKTAVFRVLASCNLVDTDQCFGDVWSLHHQGDDEGGLNTAASQKTTILMLKWVPRWRFKMFGLFYPCMSSSLFRTGRMVSVWAGHGNHLSASSKYVETPRSRSKLSQLAFSGQLRPLLGPSILPDHLLASFRIPPRPCAGPNSILSHSHTIPLSLPSTMDRPPPVCHWPTSSPIVTHSPLVSPSLLGPPTPLYNWLSFRARLSHIPDGGGSTHLWNIGQLQLDYTALHPRRLHFRTSYNINTIKTQESVGRKYGGGGGLCANKRKGKYLCSRFITKMTDKIMKHVSEDVRRYNTRGKATIRQYIQERGEPDWIRIG
jgi:hypothetical protein